MSETKQIVFRDLTKDEIEIKKGRGKTLLLYKTARIDAILLDQTFGTLGWQKTYECLDGKMYCKIGVKFNDEWIWKMDCGEETEIEAAKGEASDAMKRAGFAFGIGRKLYTAPTIRDPHPEDKFAKYSVGIIEYNETRITSLSIVDASGAQVFTFGKFEQTKAQIAKDYIAGNDKAREYFVNTLNSGRPAENKLETVDGMTTDELVFIYDALVRNGKIQ